MINSERKIQLPTLFQNIFLLLFYRSKVPNNVCSKVKIERCTSTSLKEARNECI